MDVMFEAVWQSLPKSGVIGVGSGSTVDAWLDYGLANGLKLDTVVSSSKRTLARLEKFDCEISDLQSQSSIALYVDSADEVSKKGYCIKGGGGCMTMEKIVADASDKFLCMVDVKKYKEVLGGFPIALEVLPLARSYVGRSVLEMGGDPVYREGFITDSGNIILDVFGLDFSDLLLLEQKLSSMLGVVGHGLFIKNRANMLFIYNSGLLKKEIL